MKFTPFEKGAMAEREYEMYTYLNAINNPNVERYGIPAVYYDGTWNDHVLMAITLLDTEFGRRRVGRGLNDVDVMILARDFVCILNWFLKFHNHCIF